MAARILFIATLLSLLVLMLCTELSHASYRESSRHSESSGTHSESSGTHSESSGTRQQPPPPPPPPPHSHSTPNVHLEQGVCLINVTKMESYITNTHETVPCGRRERCGRRIVSRRMYRTVRVTEQVCCNGYTNTSGRCQAVCSPSCPRGQACVAPDTCSRARGVQLSVGGANYPNNSVIGWSVLLETRKPLQCTTQLRPCCHTPPHQHGNWLYPNGNLVQNYLFYSSRGDDGTVSLYLRNNHHQNQRMKLCCEMPDTNRIPQRLCVILNPDVPTAFPRTFSTAQHVTMETPTSSIQPEHDSDTTTTVMLALFMVLLVLFGGLLLLIVIIVVIIERRRTQRSNKKNKDPDYESISNFPTSDIYDDILPSPVKTNSFDMSPSPIYQRQPSSESALYLTLLSDDSEMTRSPLYSQVDQGQDGVTPLATTEYPAELATAFQARPNTH